jgi:hypothetical protein
MRVIALLTVLALAAPSIGALFCDLACGAQHESSAAPAASGSCHDHAAQPSDSPAVSASHECHDIEFAPASTVREASYQVAVAVIIRPRFDDAASPSSAGDIVPLRTRHTNHAPPLPALPLRI